MFGLLFIVMWIEPMTKIEATTDWIPWYLDRSPIVGWGCTIFECNWQSANAYLFFTGMQR
jgi:hypothetical protein